MKYTTIKEAEEIIETKEKVLVSFSADWCGPCRAIAPTLEEIHNEGKVEVIKIDVDAHEKEDLEKYGISSIPTIFVFKDGQAVSKMIGAQPKSKLIKSFE